MANLRIFLAEKVIPSSKELGSFEPIPFANTIPRTIPTTRGEKFRLFIISKELINIAKIDIAKTKSIPDIRLLTVFIIYPINIFEVNFIFDKLH
jgi:hypothetical protein